MVSSGRKMTRKELLTFTKIGMAVSLGMLTWTGMRHGGCGCRRMSLVQHTWWGVAMTGFSVWHYNIHTMKRRQLLLSDRRSTRAG